MIDIFLMFICTHKYKVITDISDISSTDTCNTYEKYQEQSGSTGDANESDWIVSKKYICQLDRAQLSNKKANSHFEV